MSVKVGHEIIGANDGVTPLEFHQHLWREKITAPRLPHNTNV